MKKFKVFLFVAMLSVAVFATAQTTTYGIKGGLGVSNVSGKYVDGAKAKIGFNIGVMADYEFQPDMSIQTGLSFVTEGAKIDEEGHTSINLNYLQLPVHFAYKAEVTPGTRIVFHAGPYAAYGIDGKAKGKNKGALDLFKKNELFGSALKRFDAGLGLGVGLDLGQFIIDLGWDMGLVNISQTKNADIKNQSGYLSVGYKF